MIRQKTLNELSAVSFDRLIGIMLPMVKAIIAVSGGSAKCWSVCYLVSTTMHRFLFSSSLELL